MIATPSRMICTGLFCAVFLVSAPMLPSSAAAAGKPPSPGKSAAASQAAKPQKPSDNISISEKISSSDSPIHITADRMEVRQEERIVTFEGHVFVKQDDTTITGNKLKIVGLEPEKTKPSNGPGGNPGQNTAASAGVAEKIDYIEVEGDVKVTQQDRIATAEKAIFYQVDQKIILRGHPKVTKGKDKLEGSIITIYLKENRSVVEGGKEIPVQAVLFPSKKE